MDSLTKNGTSWNLFEMRTQSTLKNVAMAYKNTNHNFLKNMEKHDCSADAASIAPLLEQLRHSYLQRIKTELDDLITEEKIHDNLNKMDALKREFDGKDGKVILKSGLFDVDVRGAKVEVYTKEKGELEEMRRQCIEDNQLLQLECEKASENLSNLIAQDQQLSAQICRSLL